MRFEIERKFLVADGAWRAQATGSRPLRDGLIGQFEAGKVRVRLDGGRAWLTVKGARTGLSRTEFEYEVPRAHGEAMLAEVCVGRILEKTRWCVPHDGLSWEVDVYGGTLAGLVLAEIELEREDQPFARPGWLGQEVTGDPRFRQSALLRLAESGRALSAETILASAA